ncbi:hypothetical protein ACP4OV_029271 [Aristida adscensionis]
MAEEAQLTPGAVAAISENEAESGTLKPVLQVTDVRVVSTSKTPATSERFRMALSDGAHTLQSMLATAENYRVHNGSIRRGSIVHLQEFTLSTIQHRRIIIVIKLDVLQSECAIIGNPRMYEPKSLPKEQSPNLPAAAAQTYSGTYSGGPGMLGSSVAQRPGQVANNGAYGGAYGGSQGMTNSPVGQTVEPVPNAPTSGYYGTTSAQNTMNANMVSQQPSLNPHQNQRFAVPATAGGTGPSGTTYGRPAPPLYQQPSVYMNRGPAPRNEATSRVIPVAQLNPYQGRWTIKARVTAKTDIRHYSNPKGSGTVFSFDLLDAQGGEIRATGFNALVDLYYDKIEVDKVYLISRGTVKPAQKKFNTLNNEYEITLDQSTIIEPCSGDDNSIPRQQYNFRQISEIENMEIGALVDLLGVVTSASPAANILRKDGKETRKQTLQLKDMSGRSVEITFWGKFCDAEGQQLQMLCDSGSNPILAFKSGRITDFNGRTVNSIGSSQLKINPEFPEAESLRHWYATEGKTAACVSLSREKSSMGRTDVRKTVTQIKDDNLGQEGKTDWITVKGSISYLNTENFCYPACTVEANGRQCNKKVTNNGDGTWFCERCDQALPNCEYRYLLQCQIQDHTGVTYATAFQEGGTEIIGCSANDLSAMKEEDEEKFTDTLQAVRWEVFLFKLKIKEEIFNDESRVKCNIIKAEKLDPSKESNHLLGVIDSILLDGAGSAPEVQGAGFNNSGTGQSVPTSNNTYAMSMGGARYADSANQLGQQTNIYGGVATPVSATRNVQTCIACGSSGHSAQNCPAGLNRQQPAASSASSYGSSPGNASSALCYRCHQPGHFANSCPGLTAGPQQHAYGTGVASRGYGGW